MDLGPLPRDRPPASGRRIGEIGPFRSIETPLEALRSSLQSQASNLLAVDGAVFVRAATPLYVVDHDWGRPKLVALWSDDARVHPEASWPVTEWAAAAEAQRRLAGDQSPEDPSGDPWTTRRAPRPDIRRADLVPSFDVGEHAVRGGARSILDHLESPRDSGYGERRGAPRAVGYGRAVLRAYAGLRDALAAGAGPDELVSRLADLAEAASPHGTLSDVQRRVAFLSERVAGEAFDDEAFASIGPLA